MFEARQLTEHGKIYLDAANLLEKKGWCQNQASDPFNRVCMAEALHRATYGSQESVNMNTVSDTRAWKLPYEALTKFIGRDAIRWNDTIGRTKAEVIEKLREAAYNPS